MSRSLSTQFCFWASTSHCRRIPGLRTRYLHAASAGEASSTTPPRNPFPYPTNRNPTPYQLFHLTRGATKAEIKARYYDLVRFYHPDKIGDSADPEVALARFRAITNAYDALRGKTPLNPDSAHPGASDLEARYRTTAAYRAMRQKRQELYDSGAVDDSRMDKFIVAGAVLAIAFVVYHTATTRRDALVDALARSRNYAESREHKQLKPKDDHRLSQDSLTPPSDTTL